MVPISNPPIFSAGARRTVAAAAVVGGVWMVWLAGPETAGPDGTDRYVMAHALTALPYLVVGLAAVRRAIRLGPPEYRAFWRRWFAAVLAGVGAAAAAVLSVATQVPAFLLLDMALLVAAVPLWASATVLMARAQAGRRSLSVDLVDALTALLVLGTPGVLLVAEPLVRTERLAFAVPFAVASVAAPVSLYFSVLNLSRIPQGERAAQGIGVALGAAASVNLTMQLARVLGGLTLPLRAFVLVHLLNMGLLMALPLWAHRRPTGRLAELPEHHQVRQADPMPFISAAALPVMGVYVFLNREDRPWGVWFFVAVVLAVVVLNTVRYTAMSRETRRLYAGIARMAEERRSLLARMLRGLEDDRHRTATELHSQALGSLATLGTLVQMAQAALPGDTALTVTETVEQLQDALTARAEHLRQLMLAIRPPAFPRPPDGRSTPGNDALAAALLAYVSELGQEGSVPAIGVEVETALRLDWTTMTIVYRIAQEALRNAVEHARARSVSVVVSGHGGRVVLVVEDDGAGFEPAEVVRGSGWPTMELFAQLGGGELTVWSKPEEGTVVRSELGRHDTNGGGGGSRRIPTRRHLRAISGLG